MTPPPRLFTVGHSNHTIEAFIALLKQHQIALVIDVRSQPYSQWATQFNRELLQHDLEAAGLHYRYMGHLLGGRPTNRDLYDPGQDHPDYLKMATDGDYLKGIDRLLEWANGQRLAIMCSEGDHHHCHRHLLITQTLLERGLAVLHIQPDGSLVAGELEPRQLSLF